MALVTGESGLAIKKKSTAFKQQKGFVSLLVSSLVRTQYKAYQSATQRPTWL